MAYEQMYVCKECGQYVTINPEKSLKGCPHCKGELQYIPGDPKKLNQLSYEQIEVKTAETATYMHEQTKKAGTDETTANTRSKRPGCMATIIGSLVSVLICYMAFFLVNSGRNLLHSVDPFQMKTDLSLNEIVEQGQPLPEDSYVRLDVRWISGPFAEETETRSMEDSSVKMTAAVDYYYHVVLEDFTMIALKAANTRELETLDRLVEWFWSVDGYQMDGETVTVYGKLERMLDSNLIRFYSEDLSVFGLSGASDEVHYMVLDTTEGRYGAAVLAVCAVLVVVLIVLIKKTHKENKAADEAKHGIHSSEA